MDDGPVRQLGVLVRRHEAPHGGVEQRQNVGVGQAAGSVAFAGIVAAASPFGLETFEVDASSGLGVVSFFFAGANPIAARQAALKSSGLSASILTTCPASISPWAGASMNCVSLTLPVVEL